MSKMKVLCLGVVVGLACQGLSGSEKNAAESVETARYNKTGGYVIKKGSYTGKVSFVDTQDIVSHSEVESAAAILREASECNIVASKGEYTDPASMLTMTESSVIVVLVNDPSAPKMLLAPEDHWGVVNVAKLVDDLPSETAKKRFVGSRARKEMIRAFSLICGGGASQFPGSILNASTMKQLDVMQDVIPVDKIDAYRAHLEKLGVTPRQMVTYRRACQEGWAQLPTNEVQRTIWNRIHEIPSEPIKIEFTP